MKLLPALAGGAVVLGVAAYALLELTPWPAALVYRVFMDLGGERLSRGLERHLPLGVTTLADQRYDPADADALLDIHYPPKASGALPAIVWIHGGGFLSGSKRQVANYLRILAGRGYVTVGIDYSLAPGTTYPVPVRQANAALGYLVRNAERLRIDPQKLFLAGDSAGAQIAAQLANVVSVPSYAKAVGVAPEIARTQLKGVLLYCGIYDAGLSKSSGGYGHLMRTAMWSYSGHKDSQQRAPEFSVLRFVDASFPPAFITAGNGDRLLPQSQAMVAALEKQGVKVDMLFFPATRMPLLPHEYQFDLEQDAGQRALGLAVQFLKGAAGS